MRRRLPLVLIAAAVVVVLVLVWPLLFPGGKTPAPGSTKGPAATSQTSTQRPAGPAPTATKAPGGTTATPVPPPDAGFNTPQPEGGAVMPADATDPATATKITTAAVAFMSAYARPPVGTVYATWWPKVAATLTDKAAKDTDGVDPQRVPWTKVTGPPMLVPPVTGDVDELVRFVDVPTNDGTYRVQVLTLNDPPKVQRWKKLT